ncbi:MAG: hypothetical protein M1823_005380 [Watsoniomyces obsoletus]|nr:MAG: hypothetical protein M1823_005380 [Watsoniomyces obsoletus]
MTIHQKIHHHNDDGWNYSQLFRENSTLRGSSQASASPSASTSFYERADNLNDEVHMIKETLQRVRQENSLRATPSSKKATDRFNGRLSVQGDRMRSDLEAQQRAILASRMEEEQRMESMGSMKEEVTKEVTQEVCELMGENIRPAIQVHVRECVQASVEQCVQGELGASFQQQLEEHIRQQVETDMKNIMLETFRTEMTEDVRKQLLDNVAGLAGNLVTHWKSSIKETMNMVMKKHETELQDRLLEVVTQKIGWVRDQVTQHAQMQRIPSLHTTSIIDTPTPMFPNGSATTPGYAQSILTPSRESASFLPNVVEPADTSDSEDNEMVDALEEQPEHDPKDDIMAVEMDQHHERDADAMISHQDDSPQPTNHHHQLGGEHQTDHHMNNREQVIDHHMDDGEHGSHHGEDDDDDEDGPVDQHMSDEVQEDDHHDNDGEPTSHFHQDNDGSDDVMPDFSDQDIDDDDDRMDEDEEDEEDQEDEDEDEEVVEGAVASPTTPGPAEVVDLCDSDVEADSSSSFYSSSRSSSSVTSKALETVPAVTNTTNTTTADSAEEEAAFEVFVSTVEVAGASAVEGEVK